MMVSGRETGQSAAAVESDVKANLHHFLDVKVEATERMMNWYLHVVLYP